MHVVYHSRLASGSSRRRLAAAYLLPRRRETDKDLDDVALIGAEGSLSLLLAHAELLDL